nr:hypothetical protein [Quadrisphaera sp. INWT6]
MREEQGLLRQQRRAPPVGRDVGVGLVRTGARAQEHRAVELDPAAVGAQQSGGDREQRRLARAVGAEQGHDLPGCHPDLGVQAPRVDGRPHQQAGHGASPEVVRPRATTMTTTATTTSTSESATAARASDSRWR